MTKLATGIQTFLRDVDGARFGAIVAKFPEALVADIHTALDEVLVDWMECGDDDCSKIVYFA